MMRSTDDGEVSPLAVVTRGGFPAQKSGFRAIAYPIGDCDEAGYGVDTSNETKD
jgi:hypothetical protein